MTPERLAEIRAMNLTPTAPAAAFRDLLEEVDRLNAELTEARLTAEEAWDAHDEKETR